MRKKKSTIRAIAFILAAIVVTTSVALGFKFSKGQNVKANAIVSDEDNRIAEEISNMTGVSKEEVLKLKTNYNTWIDVLDKLKKSKVKGNESDNRSNLLTGSGLKAETIKKLKESGYSDSQMTDAVLMVERVVFNLSEITLSNDAVKAPINSKNSIGEASQNKSDDIEQYVELSQKLDIDKAVYYSLSISKDFESVQSAFDEYLCALQLDLDMQKYIDDKKVYEEEKSKKLQERNNEVINSAKIEAKASELLQKTVDTSNPNSSLTSGQPGNGNQNLDIPALPGSQQDNKVEKPTGAIENEIKNISDDIFKQKP